MNCLFRKNHILTSLWDIKIYIYKESRWNNEDQTLAANSLLYDAGILAYRVFRNDRKIYIKVLHACMHAAALIFSAVGLKAVFDSHNLLGVANLYTLHSWVGLFTVVAFGLQVGLEQFKSLIKISKTFLLFITCVCNHDSGFVFFFNLNLWECAANFPQAVSSLSWPLLSVS